MTNKEKASKIANDMTLPWVTLGTPYDSIKQACEEMAKWKDEQFDKKLFDFFALINDGIPFERAYKQITGKKWQQ